MASSEVKYKLPTQAFSASQMGKWLSDPGKYVSQYFLKEDQYEGPELRFGKYFSEVKEGVKDPRTEAMLKAHQELDDMPLKEHWIEYDLHGLPVVIKLDGLDLANMTFVDHKTGKWPWTQEKVEESSQMNFYHAVLYSMFGTVFTGGLQWAETENCDITEDNPEGIRFTGRVEKFWYSPSVGKIEEFISLILRTANEISVAWDHFSNHSIPDLIDMQVLIEYLEAVRNADIWRNRVKALEEHAKKEMLLEDLKYLRVYGAHMKVTAKGNLTVKFE